MRRLFLPLLLLAGAVRGEDAGDRVLFDRLAAIDSLSGEFRQTLYSPEGDALERSSGSFELMQPDRFAWRIRSPDEQLLMVNAGILWHYDAELETATRRGLSGDAEYSPLAVLGGDGRQLAARYRIAAAGEGAWRLSPRFEGADFLSLTLRFEGDLPSNMEILDPLERNTVILFSGVRLNPELDASRFVFEPPPGVDVYIHD